MQNLRFLFALTCLSFCSVLSIAQSNCGGLQAALAARKGKFENIRGAQAGQMGSIARTDVKPEGRWLMRTYLLSANGGAPQYVAEQYGMTSLAELQAEISLLITRLGDCLPQAQLFREEISDTATIVYVALDATAKMASIVATSMYDEDNQYFSILLRMEPVDIPMPPSTSAVPILKTKAKTTQTVSACTALKIFVASAQHGFQDLQGDGAGPGFMSLVQIENFPTAYISATGKTNTSVIIPMAAPAKDGGKLDDSFLQARQLLQGCLSTWTVSEQDNDVEQSTYNNQIFRQGPLTITLQLVEEGGGYVWTIVVPGV